MPVHSYPAAEKYILSREFFGMKLGLENIRAFLEILGNPQNNYLTIHISGTNGKGSSASMIAEILKRQGYKTGLFTSPHLISLRERARVNGRLIPKRSVAAFIDRNRKLLSEKKLSFFELITAMSLDYFSRAKVDIAVIETGLGGRLDATNVLEPILTITTDISRDHMEILGSSITKIAKEKAGIIKKSVPHLIGILPDSAKKLMKEQCKKQHAPFYTLTNRDVTFHNEILSLDYKADPFKFKNLTPSLVGTHQLKNAALVIKAMSIVKKRHLKITKKAVIEGIQNTEWRGRFQIKEMKNKPTHIFDVSHNVKGVTAFVESFKIKYKNQKAFVLTGFVKRKEHQKMFNLLSEISHSYALIPLSTKRTTDINEMISEINFKSIPHRKFGRLETAYKYIVKQSGSDDIIVVIGSHYLVGEFFEKYKII